MDPVDSEAGLAELLARVPAGWTRVEFAGHPYGLARRDHADGRSVSIWAEQLDGADVVSANLWSTSAGWQLKPCEMPASMVIDFLTHWVASGTTSDQGGRTRSNRPSGPISK